MNSLAELPLERTTHSTLVRRVKLLSWLSLAWMTAEGAIGVTAGILANSIALIGYGLDSTIEGIASIVIIWRFTGQEPEPSWVGIGLAIVSITLMPLFGRAKKRLGNQLQSAATAGEGTQNI